MVTALLPPKLFRPTLWTNHQIDAINLQPFVKAGLCKEDFQEGDHIIFTCGFTTFDGKHTGMTEREVRALAYAIKKKGGTVYICDNAAMPNTGNKEYDACLIINHAIPYEEWLDCLFAKPLKLRDAIPIASDLLANSSIDELEQLVELEQLRSRVGMSETGWQKKVVSKIQKKLDAEHNGGGCKAKFYRGKDFLKLESQGIDWLVPGLIPKRGVTIIAGSPGAGKTTLAIDLICSVMFGETFLGEQVTEKGRVLLVSSDEPICFTQDKLIDRGISEECDHYSVLTDWDTLEWNLLVQKIKEEEPSIVAIDALTTIVTDSNFDENGKPAAALVKRFDRLSQQFGIPIVLLHHCNESKDKKGVAKIRGFSGIAAAASVTMIINDSVGSVAKLECPKIRGNKKNIIFSVTLERETGRFHVVEGGDPPPVKSLADQILSFFNGLPDGIRLEVNQIMEALGISNRGGLYKALERLIQRGQLVKRPAKVDGRRKLFGLPKAAEPEISTEVSNKSSQVLKEQVIQDTRQILDTPEDLLDSLNCSVPGATQNEDFQPADLLDSLTTLEPAVAQEESEREENLPQVSNKSSASLKESRVQVEKPIVDSPTEPEPTTEKVNDEAETVYEVGKEYVIRQVAGTTKNPCFEYITATLVELPHPAQPTGFIFELEDGTRVIKNEEDFRSAK
ncbi:MAG: AAA family ATPase [Symploca sp. SIO2E9]|nr:AAA family ATPase [Symploca sp. SIO2E9]